MHSEMDRDELALAHRLFRNYVDRFGPADVKRHYVPKIGLGTINNLAKSISPTGKTEETRRALKSFHLQIIEEAIKDGGYYHILKLLLGCDHQDSAAKYVGEYDCYRYLTGTAQLLHGSVNITYDKSTASYNFTHSSRDSGDNATSPFLQHSGPFFVLANRIYLVGIGIDNYGPYLRPLIVQATERPKTTLLRGVVLTEWWNGNIPVAARTVLFHRDFHQAMRANHTNTIEFEDFIHKQLRTPSNTEGAPVDCTNLMAW
jgi:ribosomal protein L35AE/L33A